MIYLLNVTLSRFANHLINSFINRDSVSVWLITELNLYVTFSWCYVVWEGCDNRCSNLYTYALITHNAAEMCVYTLMLYTQPRPEN